MFAIGIDPGVVTGFAIWDSDGFRLVEVRSLGIIRAMMTILDFRATLTRTLGSAGLDDLFVIVEDARKRKVFDKADREEAGYRQGARREGVGSIKRDCSIWEEFLTHHGIPFEMRRPIATKMKSAPFKQLTGWAELTNEHARDAAMIVFQLNNPILRLKMKTYLEQRDREKNGEAPLLARRAVAAGRRVGNPIRYGRRR